MASEVVPAALSAENFAEILLGRPLWPHQVEVARSTARTRTIAAGRQVGKSSLLAVLALYEAMTRRNILVMLVSAGEVSLRRLLEECASLAGRSDLLRSSVMDESKSLLTLSNGSRILSVPASEKQIRGWSVDFLVLDEAAFVDESVWTAARPSIIARAGSRVILTSSPFGIDHFFRRTWQLGMDRQDDEYQSWHWPSSTSPLVNEADLEQIRQTTNPIEFAREYLAEWADSSGALLSPDEINRAVLDYPLIEPELVERQGRSRTRRYLSGTETRWELPPVVAGIDWGSVRDANAVALVAAVDDDGLNVPVATASHAGDYVFFIPWLEVHHKMLYGEFIGRLVDLAKHYNVQTMATETNGVGAFPSEELERMMLRAHTDGQLARWHGHTTFVEPVWTDNRRKQAMFGRMKGMLQSGRLVLPRHPELLKQLAALEMTETAAGNTQISVPDSRGHDDLAIALGQALSCIGTTSRHPAQTYWLRPTDRPAQEVVELGSGAKVPLPLRMLDPENLSVFQSGAAGAESGMPW